MRNQKKQEDDIQPWFAVRCLLRDKENRVYEERTILIRAATHEEAIRLAETRTKRYANDIGLDYVDYADTFHLFDKTIQDGAEIFSLTRNTDVSVDTYINRYLDSGTENRS